MVSTPSEHLLNASRVDFDTSTREITASGGPDSAAEKLTASDYIQQINVIFSEFSTDMADHDIVLDKTSLLQDYCATPTEIAEFAPTALRQVRHFYANYMQSLQFLAHPTLAFNSNRKDVTRDAPYNDMQHNLLNDLSHNLQHMHDAISIFKENVHATDPAQQDALQEKFALYQERLTKMTEQFCTDNHLDIALPANQNRVAQTASAYKPPAKTL
ncbi:MAG TPA: hypothetical protein VGF14_04430 [Alphaproteobacteria bacterium]